MSNRANLVKGMVNDAYDYAIESYNDKPIVFPQIFDVESTEGAYEQYTSVVGPGNFARVAEGGSIPNQPIVEGFTVYVANFKHAVECIITNEAIDDNRHIKNMLKSWSQGLGSQARITQEDEHAGLFNYGGYTAGHELFLNDIPGGTLTTSYGNKCYDSVCFFNKSDNLRTAKSTLQYYNGFATLQLNEANLEAMFNLLSVTNAFSEAGKRIELMPDTLLVKYGSANWWTAKRLLESSASVTAVQSGVKNLWQGALTLIGWTALTDSDAWFMGCAKKGLKSLARMPLAIDYYENKNIDSQIVRGRTRSGRGVQNFRYWAGANFSTS